MYVFVFLSFLFLSLCSVAMHVIVHVHDRQSKAKIYTQDSFLFFKEKTALGGIRTHDVPRSRQALYQLSYQGNSAG